MKNFLETLTKEELIDFIENHTDAPLALSEDDGEFNWCNKAFAQRIGYSPEEIILDLDWKTLTVKENDLLTDQSFVDRVIKGEIDYYTFFKQYLSKAGNPVPSPLRIRRFPLSSEIDMKCFSVNVLEGELTETDPYRIQELSKVLPTCSLMSRLAYPDAGDDDKAWRKARKEQEYSTIVGGSTQVLIKQEMHHAYIAFRGTQITDPADIITDASVSGIHLDCRVKVHEGVHQALNQVWEKIMSYLSKHPTVKSVTLTGHSLGGMLAQLAAKRFLNTDYFIRNLVTFGSPPVGSQPFSSALCVALGDRALRVTRCADWVPRSKLLWAKGYRHYNHHWYIDRKHRWWYNPASWRQVGDRMLNNSIKDRLGHHSMSEYDRLTQEYWGMQ